MSVSVLFSPSVCLDDIWLGLGSLGQLLVRFAVCSLCILTSCIFTACSNLYAESFKYSMSIYNVLRLHKRKQNQIFQDIDVIKCV